jgi:hypothetical protein
MQENQRVSEMAVEVLARQASIRAQHTGEPLEAALKAVLGTEAGRQIAQLRDGGHRDKEAKRWQEALPQKRAKERKQARQEALNRARQDATWARFMKEELWELELRKDGELAKLLGETLPGEPEVAVLQLVTEDQRQAEEGLVALMSNGEVFYKQIEELSEGDMAARIAANRLRTTWLKERQEGRWFGRASDELV